MIPDETVERVRESADIVGVIGEYVELKRTGSDFRGPCPFHQGTGRNFSVSPKKAMYYCFVCHEGGDVFNYLMKRLGVDWPTAVKMVAEKSGIEVVETQSRRTDEKDSREPLWEVNGAAAEYFHRTLFEDDLGQHARDYIEERSVARELADKVGLGFAPREIGPMRSHLNTLGFDDERLIEAGLLHKPDAGLEPRPRFRDRLIFPIYDVSGRVVGFGGRLLGPGEPKYLNSAESPVFTKGKLLYGLNWAKQAARRDERMLVVEGYFDVVRLIGAGVESVVAPMGTALTDEQAKLIRRYTDRVFLLYDSDKAGLKATFRSGDELLSQGAAVQVVTLPDGEDPDTFVRAHGARGLEAQIGSSIDVFERKIQILERGGWFSDLRKKRQALDRLLPTLRATADPLTRDMYLGYAATAAGVTREMLDAEVRTLPRGRATSGKRPLHSAKGVVAIASEMPTRDALAGDRRSIPASRDGARRRTASVEREFVRVLLHRPMYLENVLEHVGPEGIRDDELREIFAALISRDPESPVGNVADTLNGGALELFGELLEESGGLDRSDAIVGGSLAAIRKRDLKDRLAEIDRLRPLAQDAEKDVLNRESMGLREELARVASNPWWKNFH